MRPGRTERKYTTGSTIGKEDDRGEESEERKKYENKQNSGIEVTDVTKERTTMFFFLCSADCFSCI